jgi:hypothetical protein
MKCQPIVDFKKESKRIHDLIAGLITAVLTQIKLYEKLQFKEKADILKKKYPFIDFDRQKIDSIYELGFIRLYACLESFMYEFLKYLYLKYPKSVPLDKKISIEEIFDWKTKKSIDDFIIDYISIENSFDMSTWEKTLKNTFGITVFKTEEQRLVYNVLNLSRNMLAHSGGKTSSKSMTAYKKIFPNDKKTLKYFKIEKWGVFDENFFNGLVSFIVDLTANLEAEIKIGKPKTNKT